MEGFINFIERDFRFQMCTLNGERGTVCGSLFDEEDMAFLEFVVNKKNDNLVHRNFGKFFPNTPSMIVTEVVTNYYQHSCISLQGLRNYYSETNKDDQCLKFVDEWFHWKEEGAKKCLERGKMIWFWLNKERITEYPQVFQHLSYTGNGSLVLAKGILSTLKNLSFRSERRMFLMLCFKFIRGYDVTIISGDHDYKITKKKVKPNEKVELYRQAANAYLEYMDYLLNEFSFIIKGHQKNGESETFNQFIQNWYTWLKGKEQYALFVEAKHKNTTKNSKKFSVWHQMAWENIISFRGKARYEFSSSHPPAVKKIKK